MSRFQLFRDRIKASEKTANARQAEFLTNSLSSTVVNNVKIDKPMDVVLTHTHKEGVSETLLFTEVLSDNSRINVGDYIEHKGKTYMALLEYDHPLKDHYLKYNMIECNVSIGFDGIKQKGAYISSLRKYVESNTSARRQKDMAFSFEDYKPVVITKDIPELKYNSRFLLGTEAFKVLSLDRLGNPGVLYLSVDAVPRNLISDDLEQGIGYNPREPKDSYLNEEKILRPGQIKTLFTYDGYAEFSTEVEVVSRTMREVTFRVPFAHKELTAYTRNIEGDIEEQTWRVI